MIGFELLEKLNVTTDRLAINQLISKAFIQLEEKQKDIDHLATKEDIALLNQRLSEIETRLTDKINQQTWRFVSTLTVLLVFFKLFGIWPK